MYAILNFRAENPFIDMFNNEADADNFISIHSDMGELTKFSVGTDKFIDTISGSLKLWECKKESDAYFAISMIMPTSLHEATTQLTEDDNGIISGYVWAATDADARTIVNEWTPPE